ncbi:hypothetical protein GDO78_003691 [Eleutherodactylus coqui]|uniref:Uncharacterized protein n=1 Tax=Eleutherodactylus coqui TaxID=57060 RepID=A0A8J6ETL2_ELECQ|nr:hypothetical protein GDO78_003691 [Eleutherodactylus coqui]
MPTQAGSHRYLIYFVGSCNHHIDSNTTSTVWSIHTWGRNTFLWSATCYPVIAVSDTTGFCFCPTPGTVNNAQCQHNYQKDTQGYKQSHNQPSSIPLSFGLLGWIR